MLTHPTHDRLLALGLTGIASALEEQRRSTAFDALSFEERLGLLIDREAAERDSKKLAARLKFAALRQTASVEDLDLRTPRGLDRSVMARLADGGWIARHENLLITGPTGLGQKLDRLRTRAQGVPGWAARPLSTCPAHVRSPHACPR